MYAPTVYVSGWPFTASNLRFRRRCRAQQLRRRGFSIAFPVVPGGALARIGISVLEAGELFPNAELVIDEW